MWDLPRVSQISRLAFPDVVLILVPRNGSTHHRLSQMSVFFVQLGTLIDWGVDAQSLPTLPAPGTSPR